MISRRQILSSLLSFAAFGTKAAHAATRPPIAVAHYTWFENVRIADIHTNEIDATTGASLFAPGLVTRLATWIGNTANVTPVGIRTEAAYPVDYDACLDQAIEEKNRRHRPALTQKSMAALRAVLPDKLLFLGFPNWSYTLPMPVFTMLESLDFSGITIAPFCVHGTGGLARTIFDLRRTVPDTRILSPLSLEREDVHAAHDEVVAWAKQAIKDAATI